MTIGQISLLWGERDRALARIKELEARIAELEREVAVLDAASKSPLPDNTPDESDLQLMKMEC